MCVAVLRALHGLENPPALIGFDCFSTAEILGVSVISYDAIKKGQVASELALDRMADSPV